MRIALIGSTILTEMGLKQLTEDGHEVVYIHGLPEELARNKVRYTSIQGADTSGDWDRLTAQNVDIMVALGDSRIIPKKVLDQHRVIGNHGAILPGVKGGASLVWGRMAGLTEWGVSIFHLEPKVDEGAILAAKPFGYNCNCNMKTFVDLADRTTIDLLGELLGITRTWDHIKNVPVQVKVAKHIDSRAGVGIMRECIGQGVSVYMPTRTPEDSILKDHWPANFKGHFKAANDDPYPRYRQ